MFLRSVLRFGLRNPVKSVTSRILGVRNFPFCTTSQNNGSGEVDSNPKRITLLLEKADGTVLKHTGTVGETIYDAIVESDLPKELPGYGACGGVESCATCHVIFDPKDYNKPKQKASTDELDLLSYAPHSCDTSRFSCCIEITEEMDGIKLKIPPVFVDQRME